MSVSTEQFREAMGQFATGVTVVTGTDAAGDPLGFACQSFASVSLDPPLVLFCADHRGRSWPRMRDQGVFTVNMLAAGQDDLVHRFGLPMGRKFAGLPWRPGPLGAPTLPNTLVQVHCRIVAVHVEGDHDVVIGGVEAIELGAPGEPMIYHEGDFRELTARHIEHVERDDL